MFTIVVIPRYGPSRLECCEHDADLLLAVDLLDADLSSGRAAGEYHIFQSEPMTPDELRQMRARMRGEIIEMTGEGDGI